MNKNLSQEKNRTIIKYLRWGFPLLALLMAFVFRGNEMISAYYLNRGTQALFKEDTQSVAYNLETALRYQPNNDLANRRLAQAYLALDQPEKALVAAQKALTLSPDDVLVQLVMGDVYDQLGDSAQAIAYYESSATKGRETQLAFNYALLAEHNRYNNQEYDPNLEKEEDGICINPRWNSVAVGQIIENSWVFLGYAMSDYQPFRQCPIELKIYWQAPSGSVVDKPGEKWYFLGDNQWVQVLTDVDNLVLNGKFELGEEDGMPIGFPNDVYGAPLSMHKLVTKDRSGVQSTVALLETNAVYSSTSLVSLSVPIDVNALYLQTGWILSNDGKGYLGYRWLGDLPKGTIPYNYTVTDMQSVHWHQYAAIAKPLQGARYVQIWLLNYKSIGRVYFDNISFVKVGNPTN